MTDEASDALKVLIKKRGSIKAKLTQFDKYVSNFEGYQCEMITRLQVIQLEQRILIAEKLNSDFDEIQNEIECLAEVPEEQYAVREEFENKFYGVLARSKILLEINDVNTIKSEDGQSNTSAAHSVSFQGVKLPDIELPKFDGSYERWMDFRDIFESLIHSNIQINKIQKFHYLRAALVGAASQVIQSLEFTADNYDIAWNVLCDRFNNKSLLIQNHLRAIFDMENLAFATAAKIRHLYDNLFKRLSSLKQLGEPIDSWDTLIIFIAARKFDKGTGQEWEKQRANLSSSGAVTLSDFRDFLKKRANLLETLEININNSKGDDQTDRHHKFQSNVNHKPMKPVYSSRGLIGQTENSICNSSRVPFNSKLTCFNCKGGHSLFYCSEFLKLATKDRIAKVKSLQLCTNCLKRNHLPKDCTWSGCKTCGHKHNTILHDSNNTAVGRGNKNIENSNNLERSSATNADSNVINTLLATNQNALLSTAKVQVRNMENIKQVATVRALLDCGSQSSFITSSICQKLNLKKNSTNLAVSGISDTLSYAQYKCDINVKATANNYSFNLSCFVLDKITSDLPNSPIDITNLNIPVNVHLADQDFFEPQNIDLLIGADAFWNLLLVGQIKLGSHFCPLLQNTRLGWIIAGTIDTPNTTSQCNLSLTHKLNDSVQKQLVKFWEIEEIHNKNVWSLEEQACEEHFVNTLTTAEDGRYIVSLPLKGAPELLGDSRQTAIKRFLSLEKRLMLNDTLKVLYVNFLQEYESLGHMTEVKEIQDDDQFHYFMPHHGVLKESSLTTKLRVVFNASSPTSSGLSLNDLQMTGPTLQNDLLSIVIRFRIRAIVLSSDIKMMYRQVLIAPEQRRLQRIVWRSNPNEHIKTFQLNTVTYGTTAASFLAIRCLYQMALECEKEYPIIASIIRSDMYVDDLLTSVDTQDDAKYICENLSRIFLMHGFELRKWKSNDNSVISGLNTEDTTSVLDFSFKKEHESKILGLSWHSTFDSLSYKIQSPEHDNIITKRIILSKIATIFDPLGLLSPSIIIAKVLLQKLWAENLTWDQPLPEFIINAWTQFSSELPIFNNFQISRKVICDDPYKIWLHGFADASEVSYGACVYIVSVNVKDERMSHLLCAKSKVAPIKSLTIPRLELSAALVLSQLVSKVLTSVTIKFEDIFLWSDSTIVLGWLKTNPSSLNPFVANRVSAIQNVTNSFNWRHVPTFENPEDIVSRGLSPKRLLDSKMWFNGPSWLLLDSDEWPNTQTVVGNLPEKRRVCLQTSKKISFPFERFSDLSKLKRVMAFMLRFIKNCKSTSNARNFSHLSAQELKDGFLILIHIMQLESFYSEYNSLKENSPLCNTSKILSLNPFYDENDKIIRVGGRLNNSDFPFSKKHQILLPADHRLTKLIFEYEHRRLLHSGPQSILSNIREIFWPISGRYLARKTVKDCVKCARYNARSYQPIMGNLPAARVRPSLPFSMVGIDYAGPFIMKNKQGRGCKPIKCWVALFVCFSTRAIHLELVLLLSSADFLQAFNRFISRRGKPNEVFSDNGTNFVRANKDLKDLSDFLKNNFTNISDFAANLGIKWHFIPVNSPHFGGIWEAGVKSLKHHLKRILGNRSIFFFEFQTLLIRIESILNSRPLFPLSSNPNDLTALTPAHFLIGRNTMTLSEPTSPEVNENRLTNFQLLQRLYEHFWKRWSCEYINELQQRSQWKKSQSKVELNQLVLVKDDNLPPSMWRLGRIISLIPGNDGIHRVASVGISDGVVSRALVRLVPLPVPVVS